LTVFTPTYNRAYILPRCYEGMLRQTCQDFIWLIIDDGSTDGTAALVREWMEDPAHPFEIRYHYQENQGMHGAHNTAYEQIDTELNTCIDSDDYMPPDAMEKILRFWDTCGRDEYVAGFAGLDATEDGQVIGIRFPAERPRGRLYDYYERWGIRGDKKLVYRSDLTRHYPYPLFPGETYVGLASKYFQLDQKYELLAYNEVLCIVEYMPDGSSRNMFRQYLRNPRGFCWFRRICMQLPFASLRFRAKMALHYIAECRIAGEKRIVRSSPCPGLTAALLLPGWALYWYIRRQTRNPSNENGGL
jgi:glycosyltransferase involved in cell wall biosynthesis